MIIHPLQTAMAGLFANAAKLAVAANNIANSATQGYKKNTAVIEAGPENSPHVHISTLSDAGVLTLSQEGLPADSQPRELSTVDVAEEYVQMTVASYGYRVNAAVIRTHDQMLGSILDIIA
jgi:flagellar basal-body rod protein FlgC